MSLTVVLQVQQNVVEIGHYLHLEFFFFSAVQKTKPNAKCNVVLYKSAPLLRYLNYY